MRKQLTILVILASLWIIPLAAQADLTGDSIFGDLRFRGFPINFWIPANATVGPGVEFQYRDSYATVNADFGSNGLTAIQAFIRVTGNTGANSWTMTFQDLTQPFGEVDLLSSTIPGLTWSWSGNMLELDFPGTTTTGPLSWEADFNISTVPLPGSAMLLSSGLLGLLGLRRFWIS